MGKLSKVQKVAMGASVVSKLPPCVQCGNGVEWVKFEGKMIKMCTTCGYVVMEGGKK